MLRAPGGKGIVPYITTWSSEAVSLAAPHHRPNRAAYYLDEKFWDRDKHGMLWKRQPHSPGVGIPLYAEVHARRQRTCMDQMLCQVCGNPADTTPEGTLFLLLMEEAEKIATEGESTTINPPVCARCVNIAARLCPHLAEQGSALARVAVVEEWGAFFEVASHGGARPTTFAGESDETVIEDEAEPAGAAPPAVTEFKMLAYGDEEALSGVAVQKVILLSQATILSYSEGRQGHQNTSVPLLTP